MTAIVFDVDDTLYDQMEPFQKAYDKNFSSIPVDLTALYRARQKYSDAAFFYSQRGLMTQQAMQVYRMRAAFESLGIAISSEAAWQFQIDYEQAQQEITLLPNMIQALDYCQNQEIPIGIITNGSASHQQRKINQLGLERWIPREKQIISGAVGLKKPDKAIFDLAKKQMGLSNKKLYYVGDSFENDVLGAKKAGWKTIWLNRRQHQFPRPSQFVDWLVEDDASLLTILHAMAK